MEMDQLDILNSHGVMLRAELDLGPRGINGQHPDGMVAFYDLRPGKGSIGVWPLPHLMYAVRPDGLSLGANMDPFWELNTSELRALRYWIDRLMGKEAAANESNRRTPVHSWYFPEDWAEELDLADEGWVMATTPSSELFPEVDGRPMVWQRDFWTRGDDRLLMEWDVAYRVARAVLLNGKEIPVPTSEAEWDQVWRQKQEG
jgi:hypothetical protein